MMAKHTHSKNTSATPTPKEMSMTEKNKLLAKQTSSIILLSLM
jgi:hypothetical protein